MKLSSDHPSHPFPPLNGEISPSFLPTQPHRHAPPLHVSDPPPPSSKLPSSMSSDPHPSYPSTHITQSSFRQTHTHLIWLPPSSVVTDFPLSRSGCRRPPLVPISLFPDLSLFPSISHFFVLLSLSISCIYCE